MVKSSLRVLGVLAIFLCGVLITLQIPSIKKDLLIWVIEKALDETKHKVVIDTVDGILPFTLTVPNLEILDNQEPWLHLKQIDIKICWFPFKIDFIRLQEINILKRPVFLNSSFNISDLIPGLIKQRALQEFHAQSITLDASLLGKAYEGKLCWQLHPVKGQNVALKTSIGSLSATLIRTEADEIDGEDVQLLYQDFTLKGAFKVFYPCDKPFRTNLTLSINHPSFSSPLPLSFTSHFDSLEGVTNFETKADLSCLEKLKNIFGEGIICSWAIKKNDNILAIENMALSFADKTLTGNLQINKETQDLKGLCKANFSPSVQPLTAALGGTITHPHLKITSPDHQTTADVEWDQKTDTLKFDFLLKKLVTKDFSFDGLTGKGVMTSALTGQASLQFVGCEINTMSFGKSALILKLDKGQGTYQLDSAPAAQGMGLGLNSKGHLSLEKDNPKIKGDLNVKTFIARSKKKTGQLTKKNIEIQTTFEGSLQQLTWSSVYKPTASEPLSLKGKLSLEGGKISPNSPCRITANGPFNLSVLMPWLSNGDRISGKAFIDLVLTGSYTNPILEGMVKIKKGFYEIAEFGTCIGDINLDLQAKGSTLTIQNLQATDGTNRASPQGQVIGQGLIQLKDLFNPFLDISLKLQDFQVAASDSFFARADGNITFKGPCQDAKVEGSVTLNPAKLMLEEINPPPPIAVIKLIEPALKPGSKPKEQEHKKSDLKIFPILLALKAPKRFMIQGFGLESLWEGQLDVIGHLSDTQLVGSINLVKGKLDLLGKIMKISEGKITYGQIVPNDPLLSITAVREIDGVMISLIVEGRASSPRFTFLSNPAMAEEEILSRLLFGRELNKISMSQSLQLAAAVASMNGQKGLNIMDKVRSSFGLDSLEIKESTNDGDGSTSQALSIGKELGKVRISLDQSVTTGRSKATISTAITPSLNLEVDIGGSQSSNIGLSWIKRY